MFRIAVEPPEEATLRAIGDGLSAFNVEVGGAAKDPDEFVVAARDRVGALLGGVRCDLYFDGLFVEWFWVDPARRGAGLGRSLLAEAETEGAGRGALMAHLDTFEFQARGFYEKCGYAVFGVLDYPSGPRRYYMKKLIGAAA